MCAQALQSTISNYNILRELWQELLLIVKDTEMKIRNQVVDSSIYSFYGLVLGQVLLRRSDMTLQSQRMSAASQKITEMTLNRLSPRS